MRVGGERVLAARRQADVAEDSGPSGRRSVDRDAAVLVDRERHAVHGRGGERREQVLPRLAVHGEAQKRLPGAGVLHVGDGRGRGLRPLVGRDAHEQRHVARVGVRVDLQGRQARLHEVDRHLAHGRGRQLRGRARRCHKRVGPAVLWQPLGRQHVELRLGAALPLVYRAAARLDAHREVGERPRHVVVVQPHVQRHVLHDVPAVRLGEHQGRGLAHVERARAAPVAVVRVRALGAHHELHGGVGRERVVDLDGLGVPLHLHVGPSLGVGQRVGRLRRRLRGAVLRVVPPREGYRLLRRRHHHARGGRHDGGSARRAYGHDRVRRAATRQRPGCRACCAPGSTTCRRAACPGPQ